jgi:hypothetical protein
MNFYLGDFITRMSTTKVKILENNNKSFFNEKWTTNNSIER